MNFPNIDKIKFTISVSPSLSRFNFNILQQDSVLEKLSHVADRIHDVNFTCHIPPFMVDAHGVLMSETENRLHLKHMVALQEKTGIRVTPVFNNIFVPNTYSALETFVDHFRRLYDLGIRSVCIPHLLWMKIGLFQKNFPDVKIKNTVLRRVKSGQDFWNHAEAGYDYINLAQSIVRDRDALMEVASAQRVFEKLTGRHILTSIITGEGCLGACPIQDEHYLHTMSHPAIHNNEKNTDIFRYPQKFSCLSTTDPSLVSSLTSLGLPPFRDDLEEICAYFDIIKLVGRRAIQSLTDSIEAIAAIRDNDRPFALQPSEVIDFLAGHDGRYASVLAKWRKKLKTCRYQCWQCEMCSELIGLYISDNISVQQKT